MIFPFKPHHFEDFPAMLDDTPLSGTLGTLAGASDGPDSPDE